MAKSDVIQLDFAKEQSRVLVTHDNDFLILNRQGIDHSGIVYCRKDTKSLGYIIGMLILLYEVATFEEMKGRVEYL